MAISYVKGKVFEFMYLLNESKTDVANNTSLPLKVGCSDMPYLLEFVQSVKF